MWIPLVIVDMLSRGKEGSPIGRTLVQKIGRLLLMDLQVKVHDLMMK
jgi:hypothetical protein